LRKSATVVPDDLRRTIANLQAEVNEIKEIRMAKVVLIGLEKAAALQIGRALESQNHLVVSQPLDAGANELVSELIDADIVFAAGEGKMYVPVLNQVREMNPGMPFVVVTRFPETTDWLDALEAGATDYCSAPFENHQLRWLMESALPRARAAVAA
jgi:DNA-binding response OmpR family regulator